MPKVQPKSSLVKSLKSAAKPRPKGPVWEGPCGTGPQGGVSQSLLGRYLTCKERFRLMVIEGLKARDTFSPPLEFGNMWHACEEGLAAARYPWQDSLDAYVYGLCKRFPMDRQKIDHWYSVTRELFPLYVDHWAKHNDVKNRTPLLSEQPFDVPYRLPSGRVVRLRGKWDSVDLVQASQRVTSRKSLDADSGIWIQENKTKSSIDRQKIERQLRFDLQTMVYVIALEGNDKNGYQPGLGKIYPTKGVRYNVVRRSAHKSTDSMLKKLEEDRADGRIREWFDRWNVEVSATDVHRFKRECLEPELENLCDDYEWWTWCKALGGPRSTWYDHAVRAKQFPNHRLRHSRRPFGVYDVLAEGGSSDLDAYLETGSEVGLQRTDDLFPELK